VPVHDLILAPLFWLVGFFLLWRIPPWSEGAAGGEDPAGESLPRISIVIPARNEERRIPPLLQSLAGQTLTPQQVIVVDDHSSDGTADVARQMGATLLPSETMPAGWNGKPWACWQGAQHSTGEVLIFLDADTWLEPAGLEKIVRVYLRRGGLLTVQPYHVTYKPYEQLSAFFNIVQVAGINAFTALGERIRPSAGFGPCTVCSREEYLLVGGHQGVRTEILEDIALARLFSRQKLPVTCYGGRGALSFRMYGEGLGQLVEGWSKGMGIGAFSIRPLFLLLTVAWVTGCFIAASALIRSLIAPAWPAIWPPLVIYLAYACQIGWMLGQIGRFRWWVAPLFPIPLLFFALVTLRSVIMTHVLGRVAWRGRTIPTSRRKGRWRS